MIFSAINRPFRTNIIPFCHFFFFNDTATTDIYTLSLHDALPILLFILSGFIMLTALVWIYVHFGKTPDRKSTRLNSRHVTISYAVFCLKKKKKNESTYPITIHKTRNAQHTKNNIIK